MVKMNNGQSAGNQVSKFIYWDPTLWVDPNLLRTIGILRDYTLDIQCKNLDDDIVRFILKGLKFIARFTKTQSN
jgi:hypothetical protein